MGYYYDSFHMGTSEGRDGRKNFKRGSFYTKSKVLFLLFEGQKWSEGNKEKLAPRRKIHLIKSVP